MKRDIFNGKVKSKYSKSIISMMIFASIVFIAVATFFLLLAVFYDKAEFEARIVLFVVSGVSYLFAVIYPLMTVLCIRKYPKYKRLTKFFIKEYAFVDDIEKDN